MASSASLEHLKVSPLSDDAHELLVAGVQFAGASVVGEAVEGFVIIEHRYLALNGLDVVVLEHSEGEGGVWFVVGGRVEFVPQELLGERPRFVRAVAGTEEDGGRVSAINIKDGEARHRGLGVCAC